MYFSDCKIDLSENVELSKEVCDALLYLNYKFDSEDTSKDHTHNLPYIYITNSKKLKCGHSKDEFDKCKYMKISSHTIITIAINKLKKTN